MACGRSPAEILGSNPTGGMDICCECRVLSGRGLCDELITRPEESYRLCCVVVCDIGISRMGAPYIYIYDISSLRVNVQEHCCEKFLQVGSQGIGQVGPASSQLFQFWNKSV